MGLLRWSYRVLLEVVFFFFAVAPPGLFRPDVVPQTFFVIV